LATGSVDGILRGTVLAPNNTKDTFTGNDTDANARARANAILPEGGLSYTITEPGNYAVQISGVIKGNGFTAAQSFSVTASQFSISNTECQ
jgi:hypothetical protein